MPSIEGLCICFNTMVVEFYFVSNFPGLFGVLCGALENIKRKKIVANVVRELTLFSMYRGLKKSLRLPKQLKQTIDSVHISFGKNGIMRFILDK